MEKENIMKTAKFMGHKRDWTYEVDVDGFVWRLSELSFREMKKVLKELKLFLCDSFYWTDKHLQASLRVAYSKSKLESWVRLCPSTNNWEFIIFSKEDGSIF